MLKFDHQHPAYPSHRQPLLARNVVATSHPLAAQAGLRILGQGGNAVDAAIATAAAMTFLEPCANGLGSDAFAIVWDGQQLHGLNASGAAPQAWTPEYFKQRYGTDATSPPLRGWDAVTVPGAVGGWVALQERLGRLPFADVLAPAIEMAERGEAVPVLVQRAWARAAQVSELTRQPGFADMFLPRGRVPEVGERFRAQGAARLLKAVAQSRGEAFYKGEIASALAKAAREQGGALTEADLAAYKPEWVTPLAQGFEGHTLHEIPPNGQGIAAQMALGFLQHFDLAALPIDSAACQHLQIEAIKLAFADLHAHVAEARHMHLPVSSLLDRDYLARRARLIDPRRAQHFGPGTPPKGGTIYLSAADASGMMVSFIQSNYMGFGSGVVLPEWGLSLQNRGHGFSLDAAHPNVVAPGKRPFHTIIPGFLSSNGQPQMSFGVMGGHMQPQGHVQTLVRMLCHRQNPQVACDAPRWRFEHGLSLSLEQGAPEALRTGLAALGHQLTDITDPGQFGAGQFIWRDDAHGGGYIAASDPRRDGAAVGF
ncbi:MAG: gamma-glutamyltransferase [Ideonella sp. MAG2]|nr:MAG: gamma-glutamyltransferase [Ideonella sp. MAG2]